MPKTQNIKSKPLTRKEEIKLIAKTKAQSFKKETKKALSTAIMAAFGFVIALVWKDVITEWVTILVKSSPIGGKLIEAFIVTIIAVIGIIIVTKIFAEKN